MDSIANGVPKEEQDLEVVITRDQWHARKPKIMSKMIHPIPYVVIHHSYIPAACYDREQCSLAMKQMQDYHMDHKKFSDIGYHFAIGSDGSIFEGRGWMFEGSHAYNFNPVALGLCLIGDWRNNIPPPEQIQATQSIIATGIQNGYLSKDYRLVGHRQVRETECPGDALFELIKTWDHYSTFPASPDDLLDVKELPDHIKNSILQNKK